MLLVEGMVFPQVIAQQKTASRVSIVFLINVWPFRGVERTQIRFDIGSTGIRRAGNKHELKKGTWFMECNRFL